MLSLRDRADITPGSCLWFQHASINLGFHFDLFLLLFDLPKNAESKQRLQNTPICVTLQQDGDQPKENGKYKGKKSLCVLAELQSLMTSRHCGFKSTSCLVKPCD